MHDYAIYILKWKVGYFKFFIQSVSSYFFFLLFSNPKSLYNLSSFLFLNFFHWTSSLLNWSIFIYVIHYYFSFNFFIILSSIGGVTQKNDHLNFILSYTEIYRIQKYFTLCLYSLGKFMLERKHCLGWEVTCEREVIIILCLLSKVFSFVKITFIIFYWLYIWIFFLNF